MLSFASLCTKMSASLTIQLLSCNDTLKTEETEHKCSLKPVTSGLADQEFRWKEFLPFQSRPPPASSPPPPRILGPHQADTAAFFTAFLAFWVHCLSHLTFQLSLHGFLLCRAAFSPFVVAVGWGEHGHFPWRAWQEQSLSHQLYEWHIFTGSSGGSFWLSTWLHLQLTKIQKVEGTPARDFCLIWGR